MAKLEPFVGGPPPYVERRDQMDQSAGLTVKHGVEGRGAYTELVSEYAGPLDALHRSRLLMPIANYKVPSSKRHCTKRGIDLPWSPNSFRGGVFGHERGTLVMRLKEWSPSSFETMEGGVEHYRYHEGDAGWGSYSVFLGARDALIRNSIVCPGDFPPEGDTETSFEIPSEHGHGVTVWELFALDDGQYEYRRYSGIERELLARKADKEAMDAATRRRPIDASVEAFRDRVARNMECLFDELLGICENQRGRETEFYFDEATLAAVRSGMEDVADAIESGAVKKRTSRATQRSTQSPREPQVDRAFERFLGQLHDGHEH